MSSPAESPNGQTTSSTYSSHPSRRDNHSVSSTHSRASERNSRTAASPAVESAVTKLLVSIKQLLEALNQWSALKITEVQVSDVYVRLGNDFNAAVAAFVQYGIDMSELLSVPADLRSVLEQCLSEDASVANLELYLPTVRQIITQLLQGLRNKQSIYRRIISDRRHRTTDSQASDRSDTRTGRVGRTDSGSSGLARSGHVRTAGGSDGSGSGGGGRVSMSETSSQRRVVSSARRKDLISQASGMSSRASSHAEEDVVHSAGPSRPKTPAFEDEEVDARPSTEPRVRQMSGPVNGPSSAGPSSSVPPKVSSEIPEPHRRSMTPGPPLQENDDADMTVTGVPVQKHERVPDSITRYSLKDVPAVVVDEATPPPSSDNIAATYKQATPTPESPPEPTPETSPDTAAAPVMDASLAALKRSDVLERRASKRFSTYNISKMTGIGLRERLGFGSRANRRSIVADSSNLTTGELNVLTEEDETDSGGGGKGKGKETSRSKSREGSTRRSPRPATPGLEEEEEAPPLPPLPESSSPKKPAPPLPPSKDDLIRPDSRQNNISPSSTLDQLEGRGRPSTLTIFLQLGREVKKVSIERGLSFASLRVLFVDKFSYSPGQDNFPAIYIKDPSSGVMYELEDVDEVKDRCLLSLNIDPLDQVKQHIDQQMSTISQELRELRSTVGNTRLVSRQPTIVAQPFNEVETSSVPRPSDKQFQRIARRISRLVTDHEHPHVNGIVPQMTGTTLQAQMTGASIMSEVSGRIVGDLKTQFDEVQNLRRDIGVMRQVYVDFMGQTKDALSSLRSQAQQVRKMADSKVGGGRAFIDSGKANLDTRTQNVLTRVEELQDTVETLRDDVLKRSVNPKSSVIKGLTKDIQEVATELNSLKDHLRTIKPMWKKTWEEELQNIVEEQQFLTHQEEFLSDLLDDQKALTEVFGHVEKVISIRAAGNVKTRGYRPPPKEEGVDGLTTVMAEIRSAAVDPDRRMKAIAANQKLREKEKEARSDEFEAELKHFVSGKKLKMTGGAEEIERVRQKRNDIALKAMFTGSSASISTTGSPSASSSMGDFAYASDSNSLTS